MQRSHVLPDFTLKYSYDDKNRFLVLKNTSRADSSFRSSLQQKKQPGIDVDRQLTCQECDNKIIGPWENYAANALYQGGLRSTTTKVRSASRSGFRTIELVDGINYSMLKLFVLSMLWRLSATTALIGGLIEIGKHHEEIIRNMLLASTPGRDTDYLTWISRVTLRGEIAGAAQAFRTKVDDHNVVVIITGGFRYHIFISNHNLVESYLSLRLKEDGTAIFPEFEASELRSLTDIALNVSD